MRLKIEPATKLYSSRLAGGGKEAKVEGDLLGHKQRWVQMD